MPVKTELIITAPRSETDAYMHKSQEQYKYIYDKRVRETLAFEVKDYVFLDNSLLLSTTDNYAEINKRNYTPSNIC